MLSNAYDLRLDMSQHGTAPQHEVCVIVVEIMQSTLYTPHCMRPPQILGACIRIRRVQMSGYVIPFTKIYRYDIPWPVRGRIMYCCVLVHARSTMRARYQSMRYHVILYCRRTVTPCPNYLYLDDAIDRTACNTTSRLKCQVNDSIEFKLI